MKAWEKAIIFTARAIVFIDLISVLMYGTFDQITAAAVGLVALFVPTLVRKLYPHPSRKVWPWVSPFYNDGVYTLFAIFMAAHVTFLNVPFVRLDLYNKTWGRADVPSHYLGGLVMWVIFNEVVLESSRTYNLGWSRRKIITISLSALVFVGLFWEVFEVMMQPLMPWLHETVDNKIQDVVMEVLGFLTGILLVYAFKYPYSMTEPMENIPEFSGEGSVDLLPKPKKARK